MIWLIYFSIILCLFSIGFTLNQIARACQRIAKALEERDH